MYASGFAGGADRAMAQARSAIETLESTNDTAGLARGWRVVATIHDIGGRQEEAELAARRIIDYAVAADDRRLVGRAAAGLASVMLRGPKPVSEVVQVCEELLREVEGDRKAEAIISGVLAQLRAMSGAFDEARRLYRHGQAILADLGQSITAAATSTESSRVEMLAGDLAAAERELRRDDDALAAVGEQYFRSTIAGLLANVLLARGGYPEAGDFATLSQQLAGADDIWSQVLWRTARAGLQAIEGRTDEAVALAIEAVGLADTTLDIQLAADARVTLADILQQAGRLEEVEPRLREALHRYEQKGDQVLSGRTRQRLMSLS
jgi:tetratricopeptide (TPR) repeat protein